VTPGDLLRVADELRAEFKALPFNKREAGALASERARCREARREKLEELEKLMAERKASTQEDMSLCVSGALYFYRARVARTRSMLMSSRSGTTRIRRTTS
jgi:hypothetical protein